MRKVLPQQTTRPALWLPSDISALIFLLTINKTPGNGMGIAGQLAVGQGRKTTDRPSHALILRHPPTF